MTENYFYPDTDEMMEIYDTLEDLLARGKITRALGDVSKVYADSSPDYLLQIFLHRLMSGAVICSFGVRDPISIS